MDFLGNCQLSLSQPATFVMNWPEARLVSASPRQPMNSRNGFRLALLLFVALAAGCTSEDRWTPTGQRISESQSFPIIIEVRGGVAAGMSDVMLARLIRSAIRRGCQDGQGEKARMVVAPVLTMKWSVERVSIRPLVMVNASLFSGGHLLSSTFEQTLSPNAEPTAAFQSMIASLTCALYKNAKSLDATTIGTNNNILHR